MREAKKKCLAGVLIRRDEGVSIGIRRGHLCSAGGQRPSLFDLLGLGFARWWRENCELLVGLDARLAACYGV
jgi:hypothetical protein